jgi:hypothetical protein
MTTKKTTTVASMQPFVRRREVVEAVAAIGAIVSDGEIDCLARRLEKISTAKKGNCLDIGGSSVRDWVRMQLNDLNHLPVDGCGGKDTWHVVGVLHFPSWDYAMGEPYKGDVGGPIDTTRSPIYRLRDATPVNNTAWRVCGKGYSGRAAAKQDERLA